ncbi:MAG: glycosyltransferase [Desulfovermiculus sp.]|nr:glycosyltransferase [Desulfovermiculus sp.]
MPFSLAVIVNKDGSELGDSETFLHAHINRMPCKVYSLIGNPGFRVVRDGSKGRNRFLVSREIVPLGIRCIMRHTLGQTVANQDTKALVRFFNKKLINVVLAEYGPTAVSVMEACRLANIPLISHFHGYDAYRESLIQDLSQPYKKLFDISAAIVGVSRHMCNQLVDLGADRNKVFHNPCGAEIPDKLGATLSTSPARFFMVGRLVEKKAPFISLLAFSRLVSDVPDAVLEIVGDGPLKSSCMQLARALGIDNRVMFTGAKPHDYVLQSMAKATCFIQHSVMAPDGDMEGTPVGVLEAMGMGLPVVSTRHGGIQDVIEEDITGVLVDEYDAEAMYNAMREIVRGPERAQEMGNRAQAAVLAQWTSEKSISRLWTIIQQAGGLS